jgi:hypothetical protein
MRHLILRYDCFSNPPRTPVISDAAFNDANASVQIFPVVAKQKHIQSGTLLRQAGSTQPQNTARYITLWDFGAGTQTAKIH